MRATLSTPLHLLELHSQPCFRLQLYPVKRQFYVLPVISLNTNIHLRVYMRQLILRIDGKAELYLVAVVLSLLVFLQVLVSDIDHHEADCRRR